MDDFDFLSMLCQGDAATAISDRSQAVQAARLAAEGLVHWNDHRRAGSAIRGYASITGAGISRLASHHKPSFAFCYASGEIAFGAEMPAGAIAIAKGREDALRDLISATARHAYDGETLLVPGVPEAANQMDGVEALIRYCRWLGQRQVDGVEIMGGRA